MVYGLTIASGAVLIVVVIGLYTRRDGDAFMPLLLRHALTFLLPFFLVALFYAIFHYWLVATSDIVRTTTTMAELGRVIAQLQFFHFIRYAEVYSPFVILIWLILLGALPFVGARLQFLRISKMVSTTIGVVYIGLTLVVAFAFFGQPTNKVMAEQTAQLNAHMDTIERKAAPYKREVEDLIRGIVKEGLIDVIGVDTTAEQLHAIQPIIGATQKRIAVHEADFDTPHKPFAVDTFDEDFTGKWRRIQGKIDTLYRERKPSKSDIPDVGRHTWSTLRFDVAGINLRSYKPARAHKVSSGVHTMIEKTFDVVFASKRPPNLRAAIGADAVHPVDLLVLLLEDPLYEPVKALLGEQSTTLFRETIVHERQAQDVISAVSTDIQDAMRALKAQLKPRLERIASSVHHVKEEARRIQQHTPLELRQYAESIYTERLQQFQHTWQRNAHFASIPSATETALALRHRLETNLVDTDDPIARLKQLTTYERELHPLSSVADDMSRYQTLVQLESAHLRTREFARFVAQHVETFLPAHQDVWGTMREGMGQAMSVEEMAAYSRLLTTRWKAHVAVTDVANGDARAQRKQATRQDVLKSIEFDAQLFGRAIQEGYKADVYTTTALKERVQEQVKVAQLLEPLTAEGEFVDTATGRWNGTSGKGALRVEIVDTLSRAAARLRIEHGYENSAADVMRELSYAISIFRNLSESGYVKALVELWQEADRQPQAGVRVAERLIQALEAESIKYKVPAVGAFREMRQLVGKARQKAQEMARIRQELATTNQEPSNRDLSNSLAQSNTVFLGLQQKARTTWVETRRQLWSRASGKMR